MSSDKESWVALLLVKSKPHFALKSAEKVTYLIKTMIYKLSGPRAWGSRCSTRTFSNCFQKNLNFTVHFVFASLGRELFRVAEAKGGHFDAEKWPALPFPHLLKT